MEIKKALHTFQRAVLIIATAEAIIAYALL